MNYPDLHEFREKEKRLFDFLNGSNDYEAIVIGTVSNFAWLTCGGDNHIPINSDAGCCILVITKNKKYCIAYYMDARRLEEEELNGLGFEMIILKWNDSPIEQYALRMVKNLKVLSDIYLPGVDFDYKKFFEFHYPLTDSEIGKYREMGNHAEAALKSVVDRIVPGITGEDIETELLIEYAKRKLQVTCLMIGIDDDIAKYRHPLPNNKRLKKDLMLVLAIRKNGLNVPITRMVNFDGNISSEILKRYDAVCTIEANSIIHSTPGNSFYDISLLQKKLYKELGYEEEFNNHFVGGITGYVINDSTLCFDKKYIVQNRQAFNWFTTITGVNVEDTVIVSECKYENITATGLWPLKEYHVGSHTIKLPQILIK